MKVDVFIKDKTEKMIISTKSNKIGMMKNAEYNIQPLEKTLKKNISKNFLWIIMIMIY